MVDL
ncbi:hypothetical protein VCHC67A1_03435A, partial [Vibrio cholerae HC-67A1]|jgi:hypothetical protein